LDLFKKTLAVCAAASSFGLGTYVAFSGVDSISTSKIQAAIAAHDLAIEEAAQTTQPNIKK
jgi:hypothetical protein